MKAIKHRISTIAFIMVVASSCTTTQDANEGLHLRYAGKPADDFFIEHGPPSSQYSLDSGKIIHIWSERPTVYNIPGSSRTTVDVIGDVAYANTTTTPSSEVTVQCAVKIISSQAGLIERIEAHGDTVGNWETSRCAEIFRIRNKQS